jgi:xanthine dehydrogenase accessory factor
MNDREYLVRMLREQLDRGMPAVIASIISLQGSSPRHNGTKMAVVENGLSYGTIGGSLLEATCIKEAKSTLSQRHSRLMNFDLTGNGTNSPNMICGGKAVILLEYISPTKENIEFFNIFDEIISQGKDNYQITCIKDHSDHMEITGRGILLTNKTVLGNPGLSQEDINFIYSELHNISSTTTLDIRETRVVIDPIRNIKTVYCFGAGHVAVPTAKIAAMTGFRVIVIDDREEYSNVERFPEAYQVKTIENFEKAFECLDIDPDSFIIIVTRGHQYDRAVLKHALQTEAGYIGMISSRRKRDSIYEALLSEGIKKADLEKVHSPIGINIGGETPEEIAVSIVAELISVRCQQQNSK